VSNIILLLSFLEQGHIIREIEMNLMEALVVSGTVVTLLISDGQAMWVHIPPSRKYLDNAGRLIPNWEDRVRLLRIPGVARGSVKAWPPYLDEPLIEIARKTMASGYRLDVTAIKSCFEGQSWQSCVDRLIELAKAGSLPYSFERLPAAPAGWWDQFKKRIADSGVTEGIPAPVVAQSAPGPVSGLGPEEASSLDALSFNEEFKLPDDSAADGEWQAFIEGANRFTGSTAKFQANGK
jgi:hypothetical protein